MRDNPGIIPVSVDNQEVRFVWHGETANSMHLSGGAEFMPDKSRRPRTGCLISDALVHRDPAQWSIIPSLSSGCVGNSWTHPPAACAGLIRSYSYFPAIPTSPGSIAGTNTDT